MLNYYNLSISINTKNSKVLRHVKFFSIHLDEYIDPGQIKTVSVKLKALPQDLQVSMIFLGRLKEL